VSHAVRNTDKGVVEHLVCKDRMIVILAVVAIIALAGIYTVTLVGMNMPAFEMTTMANSTGTSRIE
jgi:hypothetical protein